MEWPEIALRFTLSIPGVHTAIVGTTRQESALANVGASARGALPEEAVTTSVSVHSVVNFDIAPRNLNDPVCWKFSVLNHSPSLRREARHDVRATLSPIRSRAA